jgi:hypothetical protein
VVDHAAKIIHDQSASSSSGSLAIFVAIRPASSHGRPGEVNGEVK